MQQKIDRVINNCVSCILVNRKGGKSDGFLYPLNKDDLPLHTCHINHLGLLQSTKKNYNHIFAVIYSFTKYVGLYTVKTVAAKESISKFQNIFGNEVQQVVNSTYQRSIGTTPLSY